MTLDGLLLGCWCSYASAADVADVADTADAVTVAANDEGCGSRLLLMLL